MKPLGVGAGVLAGLVAAVVFLWPGPGTGPKPLRYGVDACAECRMRVTRPGFGGELRDAGGDLTTYDDIGCLVRAMLKRHGATPETWVEDHAGAGFVPLLTARLVRSPRVETPMGSGIVAFRDEAAARSFATAMGGQLVALEQIVREPDRLARGGEGREEIR